MNVPSSKNKSGGRRLGRHHSGERAEENGRGALEQREKETTDLYLPPRRGRRHQQSADGKVAAGDASGKSKEGRAHGDDEEESEASEDGSDGDDKPRKRSRPQVDSREIKCFSDAEIRRFLKMFCKFALPLDRLEAVACDAELQEKPLGDIKRLGELVLQQCQEALQSQKAGDPPPPPSKEDGLAAGGKKKAERGSSLKMGNVSINAKTAMTCLQEPWPLVHLLPSNAVERKRWSLSPVIPK